MKLGDNLTIQVLQHGFNYEISTSRALTMDISLLLLCLKGHEGKGREDDEYHVLGHEMPSYTSSGGPTSATHTNPRELSQFLRPKLNAGATIEQPHSRPYTILKRNDGTS